MIARIRNNLIDFLGTKRLFKGGLNQHKPDLSNTTVLVTGGTAGIGRETAKYLYNLNADVIITGRDSQKADSLINELREPSSSQKALKFVQVDFADLSQVKALSTTIKEDHTSLDILVNNAGENVLEYTLSKDRVEKTMAVNHLAPAYLTSLLTPLLQASNQARVVNVSSHGHRGPSMRRDANFTPDFENYWELQAGKTEADYNSLVTYCQSKLANALFTKGLQKYQAEKIGKGEWGEGEFKTVSLYPGVVMTDIYRSLEGNLGFKVVKGLFSPLIWLMTKNSYQGAQATLHCCLVPFEELENGEYYSDCELSVLTKEAQDEGYVAECWERTNQKIEELTQEKVFE